MAKLTCTFSNKVLFDLELDVSKEYLIGRDAHADIHIESGKGISRQHAKIVFENNLWKLLVLSQYGNVYFQGESIQELELERDCVFRVNAYEFKFIIADEKKNVKKETSTKTETAPIVSTQAMVPIAKTNQKNDENDGFNFGNDPASSSSLPSVPSVSNLKTPQEIALNSFIDEKTSPGNLENVVGIIKWRDSNGKKKGFKFSSGNCVVGRGEGCEVSINNSLLSRKHFEITKQDNKFYIVDLGSANGTKLNEKEVSKNQPVVIESGDKISVSGFKFSFEIKDEQFENKLSAVPALQSNTPGGLMPPPPLSAGARVVRVNKNSRSVVSDSSSRKKYIRYAVIGLIPVILIGLLLDNPSPKNPTGQIDLNSVNTITFDKLTPEDKSIVIDTFKLGKNHFNQKKYANCVKEFEKLHNIIPFYMNSKEISGLCEQTLALEKETNEIERKRKEHILMEQRIVAIVEDCKSQLTQFKSTIEASECISGALSMFPDHPAIVDYQNNLAIKEQQERDQAAQKAKYLALNQKGEGIYFAAKMNFEKKKYRIAIDSYTNFLNGNYPDPKGYKNQANRDLASAKIKLSEKVKINFDECKKYYNDRRFKESVISCDRAIDEDPKNTEVKNYRNMVLSELRKEMKALYQDAILEESLGNVDAAKEKWKKIMELDVESDEFYKKSKSKLKKFGIGI